MNQRSKVPYLNDPSLESFKKRIDKGIESNQKLIVVVGQLGSGKTRNIREHLVSSKKKFEWIEFKSAQTVDEVLLKCIHPVRRMTITVFWFVLLLYVIPAVFKFTVPTEVISFLKDKSFIKPDQAYLLFSGFLSFAFLTNKTNLLFKSAYLRVCKPNILVLDDLERSSLSINNIFHVIKIFETVRTKHIIANIGYTDMAEKIATMDFAYKCGAQVEEVPNSSLVNVGIAKKHVSEFPFKDAQEHLFLMLFTPREVLEILEKSKKIFSINASMKAKQIVIFYILLHELFRKLGYGPETLSHISLVSSSSRFTIESTSSRDHQIPISYQKIFSSFVSGLDFQFTAGEGFSRNMQNLRLPNIGFSELESFGDTFIS